MGQRQIETRGPIAPSLNAHYTFGAGSVIMLYLEYFIFRTIKIKTHIKIAA